jgi:hypothetical protein
MTQRHPVGFDTLRQASKPKPRSGTGRSHLKAERVCKIGKVRAMAEAAARSAGCIFISNRCDETGYPAGWLHLIKDACGVEVS